MKKVLIVDSNMDPRCWGSPDLRAFAALAPDSTFVVRRGPHEDLPSKIEPFSRVILSGSRMSCLEDTDWTRRLQDLIQRVLAKGTPLLGVCFGHQMIIKTLGGSAIVRKGDCPEYGWIEVELVERSPLTEGLPRRFFTFSSHQEEAVALPREARLIARSTLCAIQGFQLGEHPVYGIQFHPEKPLHEAELTYVELRLKRKASLFQNRLQGKTLYNPSIGQTLFRNFLK